MAVAEDRRTNRGRIDEALEYLREAYLPWFERLITARFGPSGWQSALLASDKFNAGDHVDLTRLFAIFHEYRNDVFREAMGKSGIGFMHEAQEIRNRYAHQEQFSTADTLRALDTIQRLLELASAGKQYDAVHRMHEQLLRSLYSEQARQESRKLAKSLNVGADSALTPWHQVVTPHEDVRTGRMKEAEFAADLDQVHRGLAGPEYQNADEFFRRTYLTEGLTKLLETALERLLGIGGDPVIELQTNFGGGKTHSMIALYHLGDGFDPETLPTLEPFLRRHNIKDRLFAQRAVLVGTKLSVNEPRTKDDGTVVNTLWGELAWQLAKKPGYALVAESDRSGVSPGAQVLQQVFDLAGDSIILIDEWVAYIRNLPRSGDQRVAGGTFDANLTFAQALTEAVTNTPGVLLAASLPASSVEVGGEAGREALEILQKTFSRVKTSWRPASSVEGFEIVRRRLFQEMDVENLRKRDGTIRLFNDMYRTSKGLFPADVQQADYQQRMESAYPFHPETFDQLFETWGTLESFQRTRGVLRLMANVVHTLWELKDASPLIMPAHMPLDAPAVMSEMQSYLPDSWTSVIERDIDGPSALSGEIDRGNSNFDKLSAARRVARTIFLGSAPTYRGDKKGINDQSIRLGVVQPGENASIFGDALRQYADKATFLYHEHGNYWFSTQPTITQLAQQRIEALALDDIDHDLGELLRKGQSKRGDFDRVVTIPASSADVMDTPETTLVILGPDAPYTKATASRSEAIIKATSILDTRGDGRRTNRNALLFLAPNASKLKDVREAMAQRIVWEQIDASREEMNLDPSQQRQVKVRVDEARKRVDALVRETWTWLLVPHADPMPGAKVEWDSIVLKAGAEGDSLAETAGRRAVTEEYMIRQFAGSNVRREIERIPAFANGWTHVPARDLATWFSSYLYFPRLRNPKVLEDAIRQGLRSLAWQIETYAWADSWDEHTGRYLGLTHSQSVDAPVSLTGTGMLVHPDVAQRQFDEDARIERERIERERERVVGPEVGVEGGEVDPPPLPPVLPPVAPASAYAHRYFGSVTLNPQTMASQVREISNEVLSHLQTIYGANIRVTLEMEVNVPGGIPPERQELVEKRSTELRFDQSEFVE